jgi:hypothetical protein
MPRFLLLLFLFCFGFLSAQDQYSLGGEADKTLIPYLKGKLYGFADTLGNVVIAPNYEKVTPFNPDGYSVVTQFGLNGIIDKRGEKMVDFICQYKPAAKQAYYYDGVDRTPIPDCYYVSDDRSKRWALFLPGKEYTAQVFWGGKKLEKNQLLQQGYQDKWDHPTFIYGYKKVVLEDGRVNFIDSDGELALKNSVANGASLGEGRFACLDENGMVGVIDKNGEEIIPFSYSLIQRLGKSRFLRIRGKRDDYYVTNYGMMDWSGKLVVDTVYRSVQHLFGDFFSVNNGSRTAVLSSSVDTILPFQYNSINSYDSKYFIAKKDLLDYVFYPDGSKAIDRDFEQFRPLLYDSDKYQGKYKDTLFLYDKNLKLELFFPGFSSVKPLPNKTYQLNKNQKNYLYDASGDQILPDGYDYMTFIGFGDAYLLQNKEGKKAGVYRLGEGWIYPMGKYNLSLPAERIPGTDDYKYSLVVKEDRRELVFKGSFENPKVKEVPFDLSRSYRDGKEFVILPNGKEVSWAKGEDIRPVQHGEYIWFAKEQGRKYILLDSDLAPVFPEGVGMTHRGAAYRPEEGLPLFVAVTSDGEGLIDLEGNWIIEPGPRQRVNPLNNQSGLFSVRDKEGMAMLCNEKGKVLVPKGKYMSFMLKNPYVIAAPVKGDEKYEVLLRPDGKPISAEKYSEIFRTGETVISAGKNIDGYIRSCLLDTLGREVDCYPYTQVLLPCTHSDLLIAKDLYDYGLIDRKGKEVLPFIYRGISCSSEDFFILEKGGSKNDIALSDGTIVQRDLRGYLRPQKVSKDRYLLKTETDYLLMDTEGQTIKKFVDQAILPISQYAPYHEGYLKGKAPNGLEYYVSKRTGKVFWEE